MNAYMEVMEFFYHSVVLALPVATYLLCRRLKSNRNAGRVFEDDEDSEGDKIKASIAFSTILEYCFSSVLGAAVVAIVRLGAFMVNGRTSKMMTFLPYILHSSSFLINCLGLSAALQQYPTLQFDLDVERKELKYSRWLNRYSRLITLWLPFGTVAGLSRVIHWSILEKNFAALSIWKSFLLIPWYEGFAFFLSITAPLCHLVAFCKNVRIRKEDDLSLNADEESWSSRQIKKQWRWSKSWRRPTSLSYVIRGWYFLWTADLPQSRLPPQRLKTSHNCFESESDFSRSLNNDKMVKLSGTLPPEESKLKLIELLCENDDHEYSHRASWVSRAYAEKALKLDRDFKEKTF